MNRVEKSKSLCEELFCEEELDQVVEDQEFQQLWTYFEFGDVAGYGKLEIWERELISLVVSTTLQSYDVVKLHLQSALRQNIQPELLLEAIYHCAPYIGFPKVFPAVNYAKNLFAEQGIVIQSQKRTQEENRFEMGLSVQQSIFGKENINHMRAGAPESQKHIQDYLSAMCFGDFYTRGGLSVRVRELLTFCILSAQGGCENQLKSHIIANASVGNDKQKMLEALTQCIPYIGFPRTLNALNCLNGVLPETEA